MGHRRRHHSDRHASTPAVTSTAIWLPRGLTRDYDEFGTNGHVDIVATLASPGRLLLHDQRDPARGAPTSRSAACVGCSSHG